MRYLLEEMTWPEVREALRSVKLAIIPLGAHEQHGPHLKESCDAVLAEEFAKRLAERLYPWALVTPRLPFGISLHHIHFPGTITLRPETLIQLLRDVVWSLHQHGLENFLILNSHTGNQSTLEVACTSLTHELGVNMYYAKTTAGAKEAIRKYVHSELYGHSCEREVSEALYLAPHLVREDQLEAGQIRPGHWRLLRPDQPVRGFYHYDEMTANGSIGDAPSASVEAGRAIVEEALGQLVVSMRTLLGLQEPSERKPEGV